MKAKYSKEILLYSLPDYVSNSIKDKELVKEIENEIKINPDFKNEHMQIRSTMNFLDSAELESPNENYFNNLSVNINERLSSEKISESFWDRLGIIWKILIPAIPLIIIAILIFNSMKIDKPEISNSENKLKYTDSVEKTELSKNPEDLILNKDAVTNNESSERVSLRRIQKNTVRKYVNESENTLIEKKSEEDFLSPENIESVQEEDDDVLSNFMADNNTEDTEEDILFPREDEDSYEEELLEFTPEEQKEILENLNKSQI